MVKARITVTLVRELELNPAYYPDGCTPQQMLDMEIRGHSVAEVLMEWMSMNDPAITVQGELLPEDE